MLSGVRDLLLSILAQYSLARTTSYPVWVWCSQMWVPFWDGGGGALGVVGVKELLF